jgi:putative acetyltransferase
MREALIFRVDDLTGEAPRALIARHLVGMHEASPPDSVHAFDVEQLRQPNVTFWSAEDPFSVFMTRELQPVRYD